MNINSLGLCAGYYGITKNKIPQNGIFSVKAHENGMESERTRPYTVTENYSLNKAMNSISLVPGVEIDMGDGYSLKIKDNHILPDHPNLPVTRELKLAAEGMDYLVRIANNQFTIDFNAQTRRFYENKEMQDATINALNAAGINTGQVFYINGSPFEVVKGDIRRVHTRLGDFLNEYAMSPIALKYEQFARYKILLIT